MRRPPACAVLVCVCAATVATVPRPALRAAEPPVAANAAGPADHDDLFRKARVLGSDRWRRATFELDAWLREQPAYTPARARAIRAGLDRRVAAMSSYEVEYLLDTLEVKLRILDSPASRDAREWLGRYLAVMADRPRADLLAEVPDVLDLTTAELVMALGRLDAKRAAVEAERRAAIHGREEFAEFLRDRRRADEAVRAGRSRIRRGDVSFSPYRGPAVADPPFAEAADGLPFPAAPWIGGGFGIGGF